METQQNGKTALITGASSGIGQELTRLFAKDGYKLVLVGRNEEALQQLASNFTNQYGTQTIILTKDLADPNAPEEIYAEIQAQGLPIDVLVNDAGFGEYGQFATETDLQKELAVVQVNAIALMHLTKLFLKDMVSRNDGKILMLGSEVSVIPNPLMAVYGATKAFIKSFSEAIRNELKDTNVTVTVLMPSATNTNFFKVAGATHTVAADPNTAASPSDVAKEGYMALMAGKDHVVAGLMNKVRLAVSQVLSDPVLAASARRNMTPRAEAEQQQKTQLVTLAVGAVVLGGLWLLLRNRNTYDPISPYDTMRYRYKAGKAKYKTRQALESVGDSVSSVYKQAKSVVEDALT